MDTQSKKPQRGQSPIFYAVLNYSGRRPAEEFDLYGEAFRKAGQKLAHHWEDDVDACPIVFLYRHACELYLKAILRAGQKWLSLVGEPLTFKKSILTGHSLSPLLVPVRELFDQLEWPQSYEDFAPFIEKVDRLDPGSFAFRYPVDKNDASTFPSAGFNVAAFIEAAEKALGFMRNSVYNIDDRIEQAKRSLAELDD